MGNSRAQRKQYMQRLGHREKKVGPRSWSIRAEGAKGTVKSAETWLHSRVYLHLYSLHRAQVLVSAPAAAWRPFLPETLSRLFVLTCGCTPSLPEVRETATGKDSREQYSKLTQVQE